MTDYSYAHVHFGSDPLDELAIPDGTTVEEHDLVTDGDVLVGGQGTVEFGVRGRSVIAGERVHFGGDIEAEGDCRLDMWSSVDGNVLVGEDAYLGERVQIDGELKVAGDLDIGDDVDIEDGFEANGWIVIRNPMPTITFLFIYLTQLLRIGEEEAAEEMLSTMMDGEEGGPAPVMIPRGGQVSDDAWRVSTPATIGDDCRIHGNIRAESMEVGRDNTIFGSLRAKGEIVVGKGSDIKGDVTTRNGDVRIGPGAHVWGDVAGTDVELHENATVEGTIRARGEMRMHTDAVIERADETAQVMAEMAEEIAGDGEESVAEDSQPEEAMSASDDESDEASPDHSGAVDDEASADDREADDDAADDGDQKPPATSYEEDVEKPVDDETDTTQSEGGESVEAEASSNPSD